MDTYQYRMTVDGVVGKVQATYPGDHWALVSQSCEDRGLVATLERRLVTDVSILDFGDIGPHMRLGDKVVCGWDVVAELDLR